jgi:hypothetical protein
MWNAILTYLFGTDARPAMERKRLQAALNADRLLRREDVYSNRCMGLPGFRVHLTFPNGARHSLPGGLMDGSWEGRIDPRHTNGGWVPVLPAPIHPGRPGAGV